MELNELIDRRARNWDAMKALLDKARDEKRDITAEESQEYDRRETEIDADTAQIERLERHNQRSERFDRVETDPIVNPGTGEREDDAETAYREAFVAWATGGMEALDGAQRQALRKGWRADKESRAQSVGTTTAGGYLVPEGFRKRLVEKMKAYGAVQNEAEVIVTETGNALPWPTNDDTSNVGALLAENTQVAEQDMTFGVAQLDAYKYTSKLIRVSIEFLQDVDWIDSEDFLARKFGERLGRIKNQHFTTGTGTAQPNGIVTGATSGVTAASATAITADELIDLQHSIDPAYRNERAAFMFNDAVLKAVRKLKDTTNQYIWQPGLITGMPSSLLGARYVINNDMAVPATGVKSVLFGDFRAGYVVRIVRGFQMLRLNERYADFFQVGFVAFERADADVQDANAYKALTQL